MMNDWKAQLKALKTNIHGEQKPQTVTPAAKTMTGVPAGQRRSGPETVAVAPHFVTAKPNQRHFVSPPIAVAQERRPNVLNIRHAVSTAAQTLDKVRPAITSAQQSPTPIKPKPVVAPLTQGVAKIFKPLPKGALTRQRLFRLPESWVAFGGKTQFNSSQEGKNSGVDIVIGLDFGTSYTKAAVGFMDKIYPVTWDGISKCDPDYLLPSEFTQSGDGSVYLGQHTGASPPEICADLKLPFINPAVSTASVITASVFLALVLRYVRAWVYRHHGAKLGKKKIRWQLNLGAPSNGLETQPLKDAYRVLAATAWLKSLSTDLCRVAETGNGTWSFGVPLQDVFEPKIYPEFVAQMAGYMQSPQKQKGLHALVDVGGGTLDVVTFIVHEVDGEDTFPFLVPQVHPLGTHGLVQNRLVGIPVDSTVEPVDELAPIAAPVDFARNLGIKEVHVTSRDRLFSNEVRGVIRSVFDITKTRRYRLSDAWQIGVRTFFTGGGSQIELYKDALRTAKIPSEKGIQEIPLPRHPRLDGFSGNVGEYQRISVACGLAQDSFTLGRVVPAKDVDDDLPVERQIAISERLDRDDLYPK